MSRRLVIGLTGQVRRSPAARPARALRPRCDALSRYPRKRRSRASTGCAAPSQRCRRSRAMPDTTSDQPRPAGCVRPLVRRRAAGALARDRSGLDRASRQSRFDPIRRARAGASPGRSGVEPVPYAGRGTGAAVTVLQADPVVRQWSRPIPVAAGRAGPSLGGPGLAVHGAPACASRSTWTTWPAAILACLDAPAALGPGLRPARWRDARLRRDGAATPRSATRRTAAWSCCPPAVRSGAGCLACSHGSAVGAGPAGPPGGRPVGRRRAGARWLSATSPGRSGPDRRKPCCAAARKEFGFPYARALLLGVTDF